MAQARRARAAADFLEAARGNGGKLHSEGAAPTRPRRRRRCRRRASSTGGAGRDGRERGRSADDGRAPSRCAT